MANKSGGASKVSQATNYKNSRLWEKNRRRRLLNLLILHPNNKQIEEALNSIVYRRKTPKVREWSSTRIKIAGLFKRFTGRVDKNIFVSNEKISGPALFSAGPYSKLRYPNVQEKTMFQLGTRAFVEN